MQEMLKVCEKFAPDTMVYFLSQRRVYVATAFLSSTRIGIPKFVLSGHGLLPKTDFRHLGLIFRQL